MKRIEIIEEIFKLYDSGQLNGKTVEMSYNGATHLVYNFTDCGGIKKLYRHIFPSGRPAVHDNECQITGCLTDYLYTLLTAIKSRSFVDNNLFH